MNGKIKDRTGIQYGQLIVKEFTGIDLDGHALWKCLCDCIVCKEILRKAVGVLNIK